MGSPRQQAQEAVSKEMGEPVDRAADAASHVWEEAWRCSVETCDLELFTENEALRVAVRWFWNDMREVDRMGVRDENPELAALCEALHSDDPKGDDRG